MPELPVTAYFDLVPDWVCEVLSPSTAAEDRADKMPVYAEAGVRFAWLIDPLLRTLEAFELEGARWFLRATYRDDALVRAAPFESMALALDAPPKLNGRPRVTYRAPRPPGPAR